MTSTQLSSLSSLIEGMMDYYSIPGCAIAILDGDHPAFLSFGAANADTGAPFETDTISGIGSCSKSMTAALAMRLSEKGLIDIDAPIKSYIPGFRLWDPCATDMVTLRDMLCHRTGVAGHDGTWPDNSISRADYVKRLAYMEPNAPFRTVAQYSNVMYNAVGGILEEVSGKRWEDLLKEEIFEPLGMERTYCLMDEAAADENCAMPHRWDHGLHVIPRWNIDQAGPCGSVMSTAEDMAKWLAFHIHGGMAGGKALLSPVDFLDIHTPQILMDYPHIRGGRSLGYGLGWRIMEYHGHIVQQHTGKIEGYSAFQFYLPGTGKGAVYLQNLHAPDNPFIFAVQGFLLDTFIGRTPEDWQAIYTENRPHAPEDMYHHLEHDYMPKHHVEGTHPSHGLSDYVGTYENGGYGTFHVTEADRNLYLDEREVRHLLLTHFHYDTWIVSGIKEDTDLYTLPLTFQTNEDGEISGFLLPMEPKVEAIRFEKLRIKN